MKRTVTITMEVDPLEFEDVEDSDCGAIELIHMALTNEADLIGNVEIACGTARITVTFPE